MTVEIKREVHNRGDLFDPSRDSYEEDASSSTPRGSPSEIKKQRLPTQRYVSLGVPVKQGSAKTIPREQKSSAPIPAPEADPAPEAHLAQKVKVQKDADGKVGGKPHQLYTIAPPAKADSRDYAVATEKPDGIGTTLRLAGVIEGIVHKPKPGKDFLSYIGGNPFLQIMFLFLFVIGSLYSIVKKIKANKRARIPVEEITDEVLADILKAERGRKLGARYNTLTKGFAVNQDTEKEEHIIEVQLNDYVIVRENKPMTWGEKSLNVMGTGFNLMNNTTMHFWIYFITAALLVGGLSYANHHAIALAIAFLWPVAVGLAYVAKKMLDFVSSKEVLSKYRSHFRWTDELIFRPLISVWSENFPRLGEYFKEHEIAAYALEAILHMYFRSLVQAIAFPFVVIQTFYAYASLRKNVLSYLLWVITLLTFPISAPLALLGRLYIHLDNSKHKPLWDPTQWHWSVQTAYYVFTYPLRLMWALFRLPAIAASACYKLESPHKHDKKVLYELDEYCFHKIPDPDEEQKKSVVAGEFEIIRQHERGFLLGFCNQDNEYDEMHITDKTLDEMCTTDKTLREMLERVRENEKISGELQEKLKELSQAHKVTNRELVEDIAYVAQMATLNATMNQEANDRKEKLKDAQALLLSRFGVTHNVRIPEGEALEVPVPAVVSEQSEQNNQKVGTLKKLWNAFHLYLFRLFLVEGSARLYGVNITFLFLGWLLTDAVMSYFLSWSKWVFGVPGLGGFNLSVAGISAVLYFAIGIIATTYTLHKKSAAIQKHKKTMEDIEKKEDQAKTRGERTPYQKICDFGNKIKQKRAQVEAHIARLVRLGRMTEDEAKTLRLDHPDSHTPYLKPLYKRDEMFYLAVKIFSAVALSLCPFVASIPILPDVILRTIGAAGLCVALLAGLAYLIRLKTIKDKSERDYFRAILGIIFFAGLFVALIAFSLWASSPHITFFVGYIGLLAPGIGAGIFLFIIKHESADHYIKKINSGFMIAMATQSGVLIIRTFFMGNGGAMWILPVAWFNAGFDLVPWKIIMSFAITGTAWAIFTICRKRWAKQEERAEMRGVDGYAAQRHQEGMEDHLDRLTELEDVLARVNYSCSDALSENPEVYSLTKGSELRYDRALKLTQTASGRYTPNLEDPGWERQQDYKNQIYVSSRLLTDGEALLLYYPIEGRKEGSYHGVVRLLAKDVLASPVEMQLGTSYYWFMAVHEDNGQVKDAEGKECPQLELLRADDVLRSSVVRRLGESHYRFSAMQRENGQMTLETVKLEIGRIYVRAHQLTEDTTLLIDYLVKDPEGGGYHAELASLQADDVLRSPVRQLGESHYRFLAMPRENGQMTLEPIKLEMGRIYVRAHQLAEDTTLLIDYLVKDAEGKECPQLERLRADDVLRSSPVVRRLGESHYRFSAMQRENGQMTLETIKLEMGRIYVRAHQLIAGATLHIDYLVKDAAGPQSESLQASDVLRSSVVRRLGESHYRFSAMQRENGQMTLETIKLEMGRIYVRTHQLIAGATLHIDYLVKDPEGGGYHAELTSLQADDVLRSPVVMQLGESHYRFSAILKNGVALLSVALEQQVSQRSVSEAGEAKEDQAYGVEQQQQPVGAGRPQRQNRGDLPEDDQQPLLRATVSNQQPQVKGNAFCRFFGRCFGYEEAYPEDAAEVSLKRGSSYG